MSHRVGHKTCRIMLLTLVSTCGNAAAETVRISDPLCGPRCLYYVFNSYEIETDLVELIREVQWPDFHSGTSMAALASTLREHGVQCAAVAAPRSHHLRHNYPVIVALEDGDRRHFVVWLPSSTAQEVRYWDGLNGHFRTGADSFHANRSEELLLTAPDTLQNPEKAFVPRSVRLADSKLITATLAVVLFLSLWSFRRGDHSPSKEN